MKSEQARIGDRRRATRYRLKHPEKIREYNRQYRAANAEYFREYSRKHKKRATYKQLERIRNWASANPEKANEYKRKYRIANRKKIRDAAKPIPCEACGVKCRNGICRGCVNVALSLRTSVGAPKAVEIRELIPILQDEQVKRSYECLRSAKKQLQNLQQLNKQTGMDLRLPALRLLRELDSIQPIPMPTW